MLVQVWGHVWECAGLMRDGVVGGLWSEGGATQDLSYSVLVDAAQRGVVTC